MAHKGVKEVSFLLQRFLIHGSSVRMSMGTVEQAKLRPEFG